MVIDEKIFESFRDEASDYNISRLTIGLGYTASELEDGRTGIAYTWLNRKEGCSVIKGPDSFEGKSASGLLEKIFSPVPLERTLAVATANALNHKTAAAFKDDEGSLVADINSGKGSRIAMVGFFGPVVELLRANGSETVVYDIGKNSGNPDEFFPFLEHKADALILTSTSLLNGSMEDVLARLAGRRIPVVLLGPTTIMKPELYSHLPVTILAGTVPVNSEKVVQAIRNGKGTPVIQKFARKVYTEI